MLVLPNGEIKDQPRSAQGCFCQAFTVLEPPGLAELYLYQLMSILCRRWRMLRSAQRRLLPLRSLAGAPECPR